MEIDIDDGIDDDDNVVDVDVVEAGQLGTVTATADLYDLRLGDTVGCDPEGCTAALTRVCMSLALERGLALREHPRVVLLERNVHGFS